MSDGTEFQPASSVTNHTVLTTVDCITLYKITVDCMSEEFACLSITTTRNDLLCNRVYAYRMKSYVHCSQQIRRPFGRKDFSTTGGVCLSSNTVIRWPGGSTTLRRR
ncbi:Protein of unknown function [Gryllus bimaculatus]|nr:Protein of unknown function [Gryllus bimaculatus]